MTKGKPHYYHDWPRRDEVRDAQPVEARHRARKNRRRWCRGKVGVEHVPETRLSRYAAYRRARTDGDVPECYRAEWWPSRWWCNHERYCVNCGKIVVVSLNDDCPDFTTEVTYLRRRRGGS